MPTVRDDLFFKLEQIAVQVVDGLALDLLAAAARSFPVIEAPAPAQMGRVVALHVLADDLAMGQISGFACCVTQELLGR